MKITSISRADLAAYYARILAEQERTGTSMRDVAQVHGVTPVTLYAWRRRLRSQRKAPSGLLAVDVLGGLEPPGASPGYEVVLPGGLTIRAPRDFDANRVRDLLEAVRTC